MKYSDVAMVDACGGGATYGLREKIMISWTTNGTKNVNKWWKINRKARQPAHFHEHFMQNIAQM